MKPTTKTQFDIFCKSFLDYQQRLNCMNYQIYFEHDKINSGIGAQVDANYESKNAVVTMNKNPEYQLDPAFMGRHEAIHLFLDQYTYPASQRDLMTQEAMGFVEEGMVRVLEKLI